MTIYRRYTKQLAEILFNKYIHLSNLHALSRRMCTSLKICFLRRCFFGVGEGVEKL